MDNSKGWTVVRNRRSSRRDSQHHGNNLSPTRPVERNGTPRKGRLEQICKASRMSHLPRGDYKIVIKPTGGIKISEHGVVNLTAAVQDAAGIALEEREEDIICPNNYQNIVITSTPDQEHANKYQAIARIKVQDKFYETNAYETTPDMTAKGVIRGIPLEEGPKDVTAAVATTKNPTAIAANRLSNTTTVIVLFEGHKVPTFLRYRAALLRCSLYRKQVDFCRQCNRLGYRGDVCPNPDKLCAGCGTPNPEEGHRCEPKYQLCGRAPGSGGDTVIANEIRELKHENAQLRIILARMSDEIKILKEEKRLVSQVTPAPHASTKEPTTEIWNNNMNEGDDPPPLKRKAQARNVKQGNVTSCEHTMDDSIQVQISRLVAAGCPSAVLTSVSKSLLRKLK
ncbi:hypothetical protein HPB52_022783 [Rhipicephalus sanguineus]|uniref:Uncharacterized protein n=1 Tax=Rhipicephalus sanguineus TaxID=34632 RepID=A0A9D4Q878_RHISA|nr:hypothetical protein HPB52_022783 [Rhipicephalus sanguineus]